MPTWREEQAAAKSKKSFTQVTLAFGSLQLAHGEPTVLSAPANQPGGGCLAVLRRSALRRLYRVYRRLTCITPPCSYPATQKGALNGCTLRGACRLISAPEGEVETSILTNFGAAERMGGSFAACGASFGSKSPGEYHQLQHDLLFGLFVSGSLPAHP